MQIVKHKVVSIDYTLTDGDGTLLDTSDGQAPLTYLHGESNIIPGLERALEGKALGERLQISIPPVDGYGERHDELRQVVSRDSFGDTSEVQVGMQFQLPTNDDRFLVVSVVDINEAEGTVTIDGNHQLAGVTLNFDVTVREVRDATVEEIEHGHAHVADDNQTE